MAGNSPWDDDAPLELDIDDGFHTRKPQVDLSHQPVDKPLETETEFQRNRRLKQAQRRRAGKASWLHVLLGIGLLALGGWEVAAGVLQHRSAATPEDWKSAVVKLKGQRKPGEPILVAPAWVVPLGYMHLGPRLMDLEQATLSDVDRFGKVWQLSIRGARHRFLAKQQATRSWRFGQVQLQLFVKDPQQISYDFRAELPAARVELVADEMTPCRRSGARFVCSPGQRWSWVGPHLAEVAHRPYSCIYAHPVPDKRLLITFPAAKLGSRIVGYTGIDDFDNRKRASGPVQLQVYVGAKQIADVVHKNEWPWRRFVADTTAFAGQTVKVRFEISAQQTRFRTFCFHAEARR